MVSSVEVTSQLPNRRNKWSKRYIERRNKVLETKEEERQVEHELRKNYAPQFVDSKSVTDFVDKEREIQPIPYIDDIHGPRNVLCSFCNKTTIGVDDGWTGCDLCPAIAHHNCIYLSNRKCCLVEKDRNFTDRYKEHVAGVLEQRGTIWCCKLCTAELNGSIDGEKTRLKFDRSKRLAYFSSMRLQAACLRHRARARYIKVTKGAIVIQSWWRGVEMRRAFFTTLATAHRVFRIKNIEFELTSGIPITDNKSNLSCIAYVINNEDNDLDDSERQMYRFDTHGIPQQNAGGRWNDNFVVYSCNAMVQFVMTLHARNNENSSGQRTIYLGQYAVDARRLLMRSFFTGRPVRIKGDLQQSMEYEPKDQRFTFLKPPQSQSQSQLLQSQSQSQLSQSQSQSQLSQLQSQSQSQSSLKSISSSLMLLQQQQKQKQKQFKYGRISFDVQPVSHTVSKCGIIEEVLSSVVKGAKKKWYAVLADQVLYLFSYNGDARPKNILHLSQAHGSHVEWVYPNQNSADHHKNSKKEDSGVGVGGGGGDNDGGSERNSNMIRVSNFSNQSFLFSCSNPQQLVGWYNKLTGLYKSNLDKGASKLTK